MIAKNDPQVRRFCHACAPLFPIPFRAVLAVSGGADSLAMMHLMVASELCPRDALLVAHFDHGLRPDSGEDARFVSTEAARLGLAWEGETWTPVAGVGNLAARARQARYAFLTRVARRFGATQIVTGHHRDDQAETFLDRLLRGSGVRGLGAMRSVHRLAPAETATLELVRPLLVFSRDEIRAWLERQGLAWREDPGNRAPTARRNRLRHTVLPVLQQEADGALAQRLAETAQRMAQAEEALTWMVAHLWVTWDPQVSAPGELSLSVAPLQALPEAVLCRCLHRCHHHVTGDWRPPGARAVAGFCRLMYTRRRRGSMVMRGLVVARRQGRVFFRASGGASVTP